MANAGQQRIQEARDRVARAEEIAEVANSRLAEAKDAYLKVALDQIAPSPTGFGRSTGEVQK